MTTLFGTNLVTVNADVITTGQTITGAHTSNNSVHLTTETGPLTHGAFLVIDAGVFYVKCNDAADDSNLQSIGIKVSGNNPLFIPIKDPSKIVMSSTAASRTMTYIHY